MTRRLAILAAIRAGNDTSALISEFLGVGMPAISRELAKMRAMGRVMALPGERLGFVGHPGKVWVVNEEWKPKARKQSRETRAKLSAIAKDRWHAKRGITIPYWVLAGHRAIYKQIANVLGEEEAAKWARTAKKMVVEARQLADKDAAMC